MQDRLPNTRTDALVRLRLATPRQHESVLITPPWAELTGLVRTNVDRLSEADVILNGTPLRTLRQRVRSEVMAEAAAYTSSLTGNDVNLPHFSRVIVTGHQPELFHAGVWAKNFATAGLARATDATALNLIIDNDTITSTQIKVPTGTHQAPKIEWMAYDQSRPQQPWEEAKILDPAVFRSFADRVAARINECWGFKPLVASCWPAAVDQMKRSSRLCDCLSAARVAVERAHGLQNLEVPMSRVCNTPGFDDFLIYLLSRLPEFHAVYNAAIRDYRHAYRMKSTTHPVPELDTQGEWLELPFWIWQAGNHRRLRPYARQRGRQVEIRTDGEVLTKLPIVADSEATFARSMLTELRAHGLRLRTRALTTTLFARVFLADLFIHGIGGAKYDAMTDRICEDFFGLAPPPFATVSATEFLPLGQPYPVLPDTIHRQEQHIRDIRYNPDRYIQKSQFDAVILSREKGEILSRLTDRRPTSVEHRRLTEVNTELYGHLHPLQQALKGDLDRLKKQFQANLVLTDREFSWCLHPADQVIPFFQRQFLQ